MLQRVAGILSVLALLAFGAVAADLVEGEGVKLNGADVTEFPVTLNPGDVLTGPGVVRTVGAGTLYLTEDAELRVETPREEGWEAFYLLGGAVRGEIGARVEVGSPGGWFVVPAENADARAEFYMRAMDGARGYFQVRSGSGLVAYEPRAGQFPRYSVLLTEGLGVELWSEGSGDLGFFTEQNNPLDLMLTAHVTEATDVNLWVPKATGGTLRQDQGGLYTNLQSEAGSWKGGQIQGEVKVQGDVRSNIVLGPGANAVIDNITGLIVSFAEVDFEIIERAISLTSEFQALATSNFFGIIADEDD